MADTRLVLLPGLDGTGKLFNRFLRASPQGVSCTPVELPARLTTYADLADAIVRDLPADPFVLVAESFSGPLAVALGERVRVAAMIFCNSFVRAPRSRAIGWIASPLVFRLPPPAYLVRRYMVGENSDDELVREVIDAVRSVPAGILASRIRAVVGADQGTAFAQSAVPALYLRGTEDRLVPESACRYMSARRPVSIVRIPGPHLLLQANPSEAWRHIMEFLDSLPAV